MQDKRLKTFCTVVCISVFFWWVLCITLNNDATKRGCYQERMLPREDATKKGCYQERMLPREDATKRGCYQEMMLPRKDATKKGCYQERMLPGMDANRKGCYQERSGFLNKKLEIYEALKNFNIT